MLLTVTQIVKIFLITSQENSLAREGIKEALLKWAHVDYSGRVVVKRNEGQDQYTVISVKGYFRTCVDNATEPDPVKPDSIWCLNFIKVEVLMMLIFKDDLNNISSADGQARIQFLAHILGEG